MSKLESLLSIGYEFQDLRAHNTEFHEPDSALGHDLIYWDPADFGRGYGLAKGDLDREGRVERSAADRAEGDIDRRSAEFHEHLAKGKPIVVAILPPRSMWFLEGRKTIDGKHVGRKVGLASLLPTEVELKAARGDAFELAIGEPFSELWNWVKAVSSYESYFVKPPGTPLLRIRGTDRVVASAVQVEAGLVLYLPRMEGEISYDESFDPYDTQNKAHADFLDLLWKLCREFTGDAVVPSWTNAYLLPGEQDEVEALSRAQASLRRAQASIQKRERKLRELRERKILLTGTGTPLERAVDHALKALGFDVEAGPPGRTDRVIQRKRRTAVVEIKGKSKSASERDAAQLEKWKSNFHAEHGRIPKGILIINAWRGKTLKERDKLEAFPDQMLDFAAKERHQCLLTSTQLLALWIEAEKSAARREKLAKELMACEGKFPLYDNWQEVIDLVPTHEA